MPETPFREQALAHLDGLYGFALRLTKSPADAEDLVQETYLRAFRFAHRFEPGTHLRAWLFQTLRNTFLTFYRREARQLAVLDREPAGGPDESAGAEAAGSVPTVLDLERALADLAEEFRTVLLLADLEGFGLDEIADVMGTPVGTVKSRLFRARRLLRRLHHLEEFVLVCSWCRKVGHGGEWLTMEEYFGSKFDTHTTHGVCPACARQAKAQLQLHLAAQRDPETKA